jgi:hypothetical protein
MVMKVDMTITCAGMWKMVCPEPDKNTPMNLPS